MLAVSTGYYTADITRTFPVNGKFSKEQLEIYKIVLDVQKECINLARPGKTMSEIHQFTTRELVKAMVSLKFLQGMTVDQAIENLAYKKFSCTEQAITWEWMCMILVYTK